MDNSTRRPFRLELTLAQAADFTSRAYAACSYWSDDDDCKDALPGRYLDLSKALERPFFCSPNELRTIANEDRTAVDVAVQLALFGHIKYS